MADQCDHGLLVGWSFADHSLTNGKCQGPRANWQESRASLVTAAMETVGRPLHLTFAVSWQEASQDIISPPFFCNLYGARGAPKDMWHQATPCHDDVQHAGHHRKAILWWPHHTWWQDDHKMTKRHFLASTWCHQWVPTNDQHVHHSRE